MRWKEEEEEKRENIYKFLKKAELMRKTLPFKTFMYICLHLLSICCLENIIQQS